MLYTTISRSSHVGGERGKISQKIFMRNDLRVENF